MCDILNKLSPGASQSVFMLFSLTGEFTVETMAGFGFDAQS
jgi:hypothetical protein